MQELKRITEIREEIFERLGVFIESGFQYTILTESFSWNADDNNRGKLCFSFTSTMIDMKRSSQEILEIKAGFTIDYRKKFRAANFHSVPAV